MIITKISDGLGNQLFMYACGYAASKRLNTGLMLDASYLDTSNLRNYELDKFNIKFDRLFSVSKCKYYILKVLFRKLIHFLLRLRYTFFIEKYGYKYDETIERISNHTYLSGYWQSDKYFKSVRDDLLEMFTPKYGLSAGAKEYINQVTNGNSIAVHVRRGDYAALGICLGAEYYEKAIERINAQVVNPIYYVFSDDLEYAKTFFENKSGIFRFVKYESNNPSLDDFFIMKECHHIIMANSSFSWWAAWLNKHSDKIVICPKLKQWDDDFYPEKWNKISVE